VEEAAKRSVGGGGDKPPAKKPRKAEQAKEPTKDEEKKDPKHEEDKKKAARLVKQCEALKNEYLKVCTVQASLGRSIQSDPAYDWANNDKVKNRFKEAMEDIDKAMSNSNFNAFYACKNLLSCRAEFGQGLTGHLTAFLGTSAAVQALAKMQLRLSRMHLASQA